MRRGGSRGEATGVEIIRSCGKVEGCMIAVIGVGVILHKRREVSTPCPCERKLSVSSGEGPALYYLSAP